jgi:vacuolar protein sorting-associated protein 13A/C
VNPGFDAVLQIVLKISDVKLHLTQVQYGLLVKLFKSLPRVLIATEGDEQAQPVVPTPSRPPPDGRTLVDLEPELRAAPSTDGHRSWTALDLVVSVNTVKLHLYDASATTEPDLKEHGIARFALNKNTLRFKMLSDGAGEAQVVLKSFTMSNTRPGNSKFREIIPAARHDRNQFMLLYTMSGGPNSSALAVLTVDSPQVIFAIDPVIALLEFFSSAVPAKYPPPSPSEDLFGQNENENAVSQSSAVDFRVNLHDVSVSVLENDADPDSQSITLSVHQILLSQQVS